MHVKSIALFWGVTKKGGGTKVVVIIPNPFIWIPSKLVNVNYVMKPMLDGQKSILSLIGWLQMLVPSSRPKRDEQHLNECLWLWVKVAYVEMLTCEHVSMSMNKWAHGWQIKWMNFQISVGNKIATRNWTKETRWNNFMLAYVETYNTWNGDAILQIILHISLIWISPTFKPFKILIYLKFKTKSKSMAYKPIEPPIGICQSILYPFTTKRHVPIRNRNNA